MLWDPHRSTPHGPLQIDRPLDNHIIDLTVTGLQATPVGAGGNAAWVSRTNVMQPRFVFPHGPVVPPLHLLFAGMLRIFMFRLALGHRRHGEDGNFLQHILTPFAM